MLRIFGTLKEISDKAQTHESKLIFSESGDYHRRRHRLTPVSRGAVSAPGNPGLCLGRFSDRPDIQGIQTTRWIIPADLRAGRCEGSRAYRKRGWHNRILLAIEDLPVRPLLMADDGYMYVAKMSGYAASYDLFTPDVGELAFLSDEKYRTFFRCHAFPRLYLFARYRAMADNAVREITIRLAFDQSPLPALV